MKVQLVSVTKPVMVIAGGGSPESTVTPSFGTMSAEDLMVYCARVSNPQNQSNLQTGAKLLQFCIRNGHWSVFELADMTVEIETSRAIAAQILRHRSFSFQEFSQRYSPVNKLGNDLFEPIELRMKAVGGNRQGSDQGNTASPILKDVAKVALAAAEGAYNTLLEGGVAPEVARMVLPLTTRTRMYMKGSVRSWIHYLQVRRHGHAQKEHRLVAEEIGKIFAEQFPIINEAINAKEQDGH